MMIDRSERLAKLADVIEKHPETFDMSEWLSGWEGALHVNEPFPAPSLDTYVDAPLEDATCGTTACIAGWAVHLWGKELQDLPSYSRSYFHFSAASAGAHLLRLSEREAEDLFYATELTHEEAVFVLREMAAWSDLDNAYDRMYDEFRA